MKSSIRILRNQAKPPVPLGDGWQYRTGVSFNLGSGRQDRETFMRQYGISGTLYGIISLLAESSATPTWRLYKKQPVDGRRRYSTGDMGSDQRVEVVQHAAINLWNSPNDFHSGFEFREGAQMHEELTGETFWVLDMDAGFPTGMWYVRPDRMDPIASPDDYLVGWVYTGPNGQQVPLKLDEVILEKRPDPLDPYRGAGPVASILPNIQQQRYATEYQRNLFLNGANPGGVITVPNRLNEQELDELIDRWRESHRGVARAGHVGVLEDGMTWQPATNSNKDMEYSNLRLANRDELREAWRIHKAMMGTADDVNRANAQTAQEVFVAWQVMPRLNRRRDTLNTKLLPLFGSTSQGVQFDYDDPSPVNAETAATELVNKSSAASVLITAGFDPDDVLEVVGLPSMDMAKIAPPPPKTEPQIDGDGANNEIPALNARERISISSLSDAAAKVFQQEATDFPASAMAWMHHATWVGPVKVPLAHVDPEMPWMEGADPDHVQEFVDQRQDGKKLKPVVLVKTPSDPKLKLVDGHHRWLAAAELAEPVRAFIGTVDKDHGDWETMHEHQYANGQRTNGHSNTATMTKQQVNYRDATGQHRCGTCVMFREPNSCTLVKGIIRADGICDRYVDQGESNHLVTPDLSNLLMRVMSDGYVPVEIGGR